MDRFYGFDLGDAESAVSRLEKKDQEVPDLLDIQGEKSFITAFASMAGGDLIIGERSCYEAGAVRRRIRFKSRYLTDPSARDDLKTFAAGVLGALYTSGRLVKGEDCCFYIGCPAGWSKNAREDYRAIFEQIGYPPVRIISESRAALVSACQSRHLQVGYDILSRAVLVIDIGSSTTDFAYICNGQEVEIQTAGEVSLGGGMMDEILLAEAVRESEDAAAIEEVFRKSEPWRSYCEFAARRLKERYFAEPAYWQTHPCTQTIRIMYDRPLKLTVRMDEKISRRLLEDSTDSRASFRDIFTESLRNVQENIKGEKPELIFLTGGVSRLPDVRDWCIQAFPEAVVIRGSEPEFSVARGLAWSGRIDEELREFRAELDQLKASSIVEDMVALHIDELYRNAVGVLVEPVLRNAALPVFEQWREGKIRRLADTETAMQQAIVTYLRTDEARELLRRPVTAWLRPIADELEEHTVPICVRHHVPYTALSLNAYLKLSDLDIRVDARNVFAVEEITWTIDSVISLMVGLLCGGSGVAFISGGPTGILAGMTISILVLALGKNKMEKALLKADLPNVVRKLVPKDSFKSRMDSISETVRKNLYQSLEREKNEEIMERMVSEISEQIEQCLTRMAEVVEIPLG